MKRKNTTPKHNGQEYSAIPITKKSGRTTANKRLKVKVVLVREGNGVYGKPITNSELSYKFVKSELESSDRERFVVILLDAKNRPIGIEETSVGDLTSSVVHPREVFKSAILANAHSIIIAHNHPSGVLNPSDEDLYTTKRLKEVGKLIGINLLDHIIIGNGCFFSMMDHGIIKSIP